MGFWNLCDACYGGRLKTAKQLLGHAWLKAPKSIEPLAPEVLDVNPYCRSLVCPETGAHALAEAHGSENRNHCKL